MPTNWRIKPSPWLDAEVGKNGAKRKPHHLGNARDPSKEAVIIASRSNEVERLIHALTAPADARS